jgi:hypothetical protein
MLKRTFWAVVAVYGLLLLAAVWRASQKYDGAVAVKVFVIGLVLAVVAFRAVGYLIAIFRPAPRGFKSR